MPRSSKRQTVTNANFGRESRNPNTAILTCRSIRKVTDEPISGEMIKTILTAGFHAHTAGNRHPVHLL
ncbi:MAG: nitroreductase family protein [Oscillospiraceae bacterium]